MNIKLRYKLVSVGALLAGVFLWGRCSRQLRYVPVPANVLPKEDKEQIIVDPAHHNLIIVRATGNETLSLPDRRSTIDIRKDGTTKITVDQFGWEHRPFVGVQASEKFRVAAGMDAFYFKKLDTGFGLASEIGPHLPIVFGQVSYNVWSNCRIGLAYGSNRFIGGTLTVRL